MLKVVTGDGGAGVAAAAREAAALAAAAARGAAAGPSPACVTLVDAGASPGGGGALVLAPRGAASLAAWRRGAPPAPRCQLSLYLRAFAAVADAVGKLSDAGVAHLDLKCDNVLLVPREAEGGGVDGAPVTPGPHFWRPPTPHPPFDVVIADFGCAVAFSEEGSDTGSADGASTTPGPSRAAALAADVAALGRLLFELLTGRQLDDGAGAAAAWAGAAGGATRRSGRRARSPPPPRSAADPLPAEAVHELAPLIGVLPLLRAALAPDPAARPRPAALAAAARAAAAAADRAGAPYAPPPAGPPQARPGEPSPTRIGRGGRAAGAARRQPRRKSPGSRPASPYAPRPPPPWRCERWTTCPAC